MRLRQPHEDMVLPAADVAMIRQVLGACADLIAWAEKNCGRELGWAAGDAAEAAGFSRAPGALAGQASPAIALLAFAAPAGSPRCPAPRHRRCPPSSTRWCAGCGCPTSARPPPT